MTTPIKSGSFIQAEQFPLVFATRDSEGHKGSFGSVAILGGSTGMVGAAILAGRAALKSGAGKTYLAITQSPLNLAYDSLNPEMMVHEAMVLLNDVDAQDAWVAGCGLGRSAHALNALRQLLRTRASTPLVLDADALNAIAFGDISTAWGSGVVVLTPHPTEASRLLQTETHFIQADRPRAAQALASQFKAWVVLKGAHTIVCSPEGVWQKNPTGNVGLASGGTGDVLSGVLGSLLAQGIPAQQAVPAAVWLHGAAADHLVAAGIGPIGMTAGELPDAIRSIRNRAI